MRTVVREIKKAEAMIKINNFEQSRLDVFERFREFVVEGKYFCYAQKDVFFKNLFDDDMVLAYKLGVSEMAVRKLNSRLSSVIYEKFGSTVFDDIFFGDEDRVEKISSSLTLAEFDLKSADLVPIELFTFIKNQCEDENKSFSFESLTNELSFLKKFSLRSIKTEALNCDMEKLNFILGRLDKSNYSDCVDVGILKGLLF